MKAIWTVAAAFALLAVPARSAEADGHAVQTPGCEGLDAQHCLGQALDAMGGRDRLAAIKTVHLDVIGHTALVEQSYRQAPFITSYERDTVTIDHSGNRLLRKQHAVWPEADLKGADSDMTLIVSPAGGVYRSEGKDVPCGAGDLDDARQTLALAPERVLLTAQTASDVHYAPAETVRSTLHTVIGFTWNGTAVRVPLNRFNHLPDAVETLNQFRDFWFYWGDVDQRIYFDNWRFVAGVAYPSNLVVERNGIEWSSSQALDIAFNKATDEKDFTMDAAAARLSTESKGWNRPFKAAESKQLAPGIDLFLGSWNTTLVKQGDGIILLEAPISGVFTEGVLAEAKKRYAGETIKAVLSTSDSWPHTGGVRAVVAQGLPVYILDLNQPLLDRMMAAPHTIDPDALQKAKQPPHWNIVAGRIEVGTGPNRLILIPIRGASTERQYMVYFPEHRLLYASDTLSINPDHTLYDPELMREVKSAVEREHLAVDTVFAMHEGPTPWSDVVAMLLKPSER